MTHRAGWTEQRVAKALSLHAEGFSMAQIALQIGDCTRNAVIGKMHRLGINSKEAPDLWTGPEANELRRCWIAGMNLAEIEADLLKVFGVARSPNSIISKANRMRLRKRMALKREFKRKPTVNVADGVLETWQTPENFAPLNVPFMQLNDHHCREITGQDASGLALYCGHPIEQRSYCAVHRRINYYEVRTFARTL